MRFPKGFRAGLIALAAAVGTTLAASSAALADSGSVSIEIVKGGFFIGASGGHGTLTFHGRHYPLDIGGISGGLVIGAHALQIGFEFVQQRLQRGDILPFFFQIVDALLELRHAPIHLIQPG